MPDFLKDYEPVEDRLRAFWSDHPQGRVMTTLIDHTDGHYIVFAEVWRSADDLPAASGLAHDSEAQLPSNMKTSALEVAETSAIGRALANLGYAAKGRRPSREEMSKASPAVNEPAAERDVASGDTSSGEGEAPGTEPGEGTLSAIGKPSPGFPIAPEKCNHRTSGMRWVKWMLVGGAEVCPKCGTPKLVAMESGGPYS